MNFGTKAATYLSFHLILQVLLLNSSFNDFSVVELFCDEIGVFSKVRSS